MSAFTRFNNRRLLLVDYLKQRQTTQGFTNELAIELTNFCNLDCIICPHGRMKRAQGFMDWELALRILSQTRGVVSLVDLDVFGESLMHPKVFDIIEKCRSMGIKTLLNTNMSCVDNGLARDLAKRGPDMLVISIDGAIRETYEKVRKGAAFDAVIKNVRYFLSLNPSSQTVVQMVVNALNYREARMFVKMWKSKADWVRLHPYEVLDPQRDGLALGEKATRHARQCILPWRKMVILWDGTVTPCCADFDAIQPLGNAWDQSLWEIWNGAPMREFRRRLVSEPGDSISLCASCRQFEAGLLVLVGSVFVDAFSAKRILHLLDKLLVFRDFKMVRY